jgi:hypothetical protein
MKGEDLGPGPDLTTSQLGSRTSMLMISNINYRHSGTYTCVVKNKAGSTTYTAELKVNGNFKEEGIVIYFYIISEPPVIGSFSFSNEVMNEGDFAQISCIITSGDQPAKLTWSFHGNGYSQRTIDNNGITISNIGKRMSMLVIEQVRSTHQGNYTCQATNPAGTRSHTAQLKVNGT